MITYVDVRLAIAKILLAIKIISNKREHTEYP